MRRTLMFALGLREGTACPDLFALGGSMNIATYLVGLHGANGGRIPSINVVQQSAAVDLLAGQEYSVARWRMNSLNTVGAGAWDGCTIPACIVPNSARLQTVGNTNNLLLTAEAGPGRNYITRQGGGTNCPAATPTKHSTWGEVKSLSH